MRMWMWMLIKQKKEGGTFKFADLTGVVGGSLGDHHYHSSTTVLCTRRLLSQIFLYLSWVEGFPCMEQFDSGCLGSHKSYEKISPDAHANSKPLFLFSTFLSASFLNPAALRWSREDEWRGEVFARAIISGNQTPSLIIGGLRASCIHTRTAVEHA